MTVLTSKAKVIYSKQYADASFEIQRCFQDAQTVFIHAFHKTNDKSKLEQRMTLLSFDEKNTVIGQRSYASDFHAKDMRGNSMLGGPRDIFDLDKTEANKRIIHDYFEATVKTTDRQTRYSELLNPNMHWREPDAKDTIFISDYQDKAASFVHPDLQIYGFFGGDAEKLIANLHNWEISWVAHEYEILIGRGNFVFLEYTLIGRDFDTKHRHLFSIQDGRIKDMWSV